MSPLFDPDSHFAPDSGARFGERGGGRRYVYDDRTVFAVQTAQVTGRPLLLRGSAGSGKSSLAPFIANTMRVPYYAFTVTARTQARDLMWDFDALKRLNDANVGGVDEAARRRVAIIENYVTPRCLWWAFDDTDARARGAPSTEVDEPAQDTSPGHAGPPVVLIDEIDKSDPDVPNNLLEALGSRQFVVLETGFKVVNKRDPLVVITTNNERQLPLAFERRCIQLELESKSPEQLVEIACTHFDDTTGALFTDPETGVFRRVAEALADERRLAVREGTREPSTAEYLDTLAACIALDVQPPLPSQLPAREPVQLETEARKRWRRLLEVALAKRRIKPPAPAPEAEGR